jgi:hypothetical protein
LRYQADDTTITREVFGSSEDDVLAFVASAVIKGCQEIKDTTILAHQQLFRRMDLNLGE